MNIGISILSLGGRTECRTFEIAYELLMGFVTCSKGRN